MALTFFSIFPLMICLFWTVIFLLDWRRNSPARHQLTLFLGVSALLYLCHSLFFNPSTSPEVLRWVNCVYSFCNLAVFPLYYLYICRLTQSRPLSALQWSALVPAAVMCLWACALQIWLPADREAHLLQIYTARVLFVVELVPVCVLGWRRLRDFDALIDQYYSATENRAVGTTRQLIIVLVAGAVVSVIANYIGREWFSTNATLLVLPSVVFGLLLFAVAYVGYRQTFDADALNRDLNEPRAFVAFPAEPKQTAEPTIAAAVEIPEEQTATEEAEDKPDILPLAVRFADLLTTSHLYLRPDLKLIDVAAVLGVGRTTLSQTLNKQMSTTFNDYVNALRVEHAKTLLLANTAAERYSMQYIGEMSGFSSEVSFYRAFRRHTSLTPRQWADENAPSPTDNCQSPGQEPHD